MWKYDTILINGPACSYTFKIGLHTKFHMFTSKASIVNCYQIESQKNFASYKYTSLANFHNFLLFFCGVTAPIGFVAETTTYTTQQIQETNIDALSGIRIRNPRNREATGIGFYTYLPHTISGSWSDAAGWLVSKVVMILKHYKGIRRCVLRFQNV
jgi:hypothetical protein